VVNDVSTGNPSIVFVGSVRSSYVTLSSLLDSGANVRAVFGLAPEVDGRVSDYVHLKELAGAHGIPYADFIHVNDPRVVEAIESHAPDYLWVIGLSQLIGPVLRGLPRRGCVGFHPTRLPIGRGRAAIAWSILADVPLAATFFLIDDGVDSGPILSQLDVLGGPDDDATARYRALYDVIPAAVAAAQKNVEAGDAGLLHQVDDHATYLGVRRPRDGTIDWGCPAMQVVRLVRASASPHPGAWTSDRHILIRVDRCAVTPPGRYIGIPGRIVEVRPDGAFVVATSDGAVDVVAFHADADWQPRAGIRLGFDAEAEIHRLGERIAALESLVERLTATVSSLSV